MTERIKGAMQSCADDPDAGQPALQSLLEQNRERFVRSAIPVLQGDRDAPAYDDLLKLLAGTDELALRLCDPEAFTREAAVQLAQQIAQIDPQLDSRLVRLLPSRDGTLSDSSNVAAIERILELLEAVSSSARIVNPLAHLMRDPNQRLRAKAALIMGRRVQNTSLVEDCLQNQGDARVRANAIESQWGSSASSVGELLLSASQDSNNRVVGNALVGLYRLRDQSVIVRILAMAGDARPLFRATAAWTMGQTADPRFLPALEKLARDLYASVRKNAAKSIALLPEAGKVEGRLVLRTLQREDAPGVPSRQFIQALGPDGEPVRELAATQFILWREGKPVADYRTIEHAVAEPLGVGFALCQDPGISPQELKNAQSAVLGCLEIKRPDHQWAFAKFVSERVEGNSSAEPAVDRRTEPAVFYPDGGKLERSISDSPIGTHYVPATHAAIDALLTAVLKVRARRHLIVLASSQLILPGEMAAAVDNAVANKVAIHAVTIGSPHPSIVSMCQRTQGILAEVADASELASEYRRLYRALTHYYEIRFEPHSGTPARLEVYCQAGYGECNL